jgi:hypothetical protein
MSKELDDRYHKLIKSLGEKTKDLTKLLKNETNELKKLTEPIKVVVDFKKTYDINDAERGVNISINQMIEQLKYMETSSRSLENSVEILND